MHAFVKVNRSEMPHNNGELFYVVMRVNNKGVLTDLLDDSDYPFAWGFRDIKHALRVADHFNDHERDPEDETCSELARRLASEER